MATNMKAPLCARTLRNAHKAYPEIEGTEYSTPVIATVESSRTAI